MSVLPILTWPDPRLAEACAPVAGEDLGSLEDDLLETMYDASGRGLAAPQVGVLRRLFVMDVTWKETAPSPMVFVNPELVGVSEETCEMTEVCLSIPGVEAGIVRPTEITLAWTRPDGVRTEAHLSGDAARCAQHELDHLDGRVTFDRLDAAARVRAEAAYEG